VPPLFSACAKALASFFDAELNRTNRSSIVEAVIPPRMYSKSISSRSLEISLEISLKRKANIYEKYNDDGKS